MANPLIAQGVLNRVRASVIWTAFPSLNITAPYLGRDGISLAPDNPVTTFLATMTGAIPSKEVYQKMTLTIHLLKPQQLADLYKQQIESDSFLGAGTVRPDVQDVGLGPFGLSNCSIENYRDLAFSGRDEGFIVSIGGYYNINSSLFD
jgi:hypothetical protein